MARGNPGELRRRRLGMAVVAVLALIALVSIWSRSGTEDGGSADGPTDTGADRRGATAGAGGERDHGTEEARPGAERVAPLRLMTARVTPDATATTGVVTGVVVSRGDETPVPDATLSFMRAGVTHDVTSGEDGTFRFEPPSAGRYVLAFASAEGFLPFAPEIGHSPIAFVAREGRRVEGVRVHLVPEIDYEGLVVDAEGDPVEGARVRLLTADTGEQRLSPVDATFTSGADGTFSFHAPDDAVLEARHPEHGVGRAAVGFETQVSKRLVIQLDPDADHGADGVIAGRVVDADGEPVPDAAVRAIYEVETRAAPGAELHPLVQATSAPDGRFRLEGLDDGAYTLVASAPGHATARRPGVEPGATDVRLELGREAVIRGEVVDAEGAPVPAFAVVVQRAVGAVERRTVAVQNVFDPDGTFEIGGLRRGDYLVSAVASGRAESSVARVTAPNEDGVRLVLPEGGRLAGRVTSSGGGPIDGARVTLEGGVGGGVSTVPLTVTTTTDARGAYELAGVGAEPSSIFVAAEGHHARVVSGLRVAPGETVRQDVELTATGPDETPRVELAGIGAVLSAEGDVLVIGRVVEGGGAAEVGLGPGDAIEAVEGVPVGELGFGGSIERIRGPEGSTVRLRIRRPDGEAVEMDVPRRRIRA